MSLRPSRKSSSMFSICVPAFRRWELHQAVKVWGGRAERAQRVSMAAGASSKGAGPWPWALPFINTVSDIYSDPGRSI